MLVESTVRLREVWQFTGEELNSSNFSLPFFLLNNVGKYLLQEWRTVKKRTFNPPFFLSSFSEKSRTLHLPSFSFFLFAFTLESLILRKKRGRQGEDLASIFFCLYKVSCVREGGYLDSCFIPPLSNPPPFFKKKPSVYWVVGGKESVLGWGFCANFLLVSPSSSFPASAKRNLYGKIREGRRKTSLSFPPLPLPLLSIPKGKGFPCF